MKLLKKFRRKSMTSETFTVSG